MGNAVAKMSAAHNDELVAKSVRSVHRNNLSTNITAMGISHDVAHREQDLLTDVGMQSCVNTWVRWPERRLSIGYALGIGIDDRLFVESNLVHKNSPVLKRAWE